MNYENRTQNIYFITKIFRTSDFNKKMNRDNKNINLNSTPEENGWNDQDMPLSGEDAAIFAAAGAYLRADSDIDDVMNDPAYKQVSEHTAGITSEFKNRGCDPERVQFLSDSLAEAHASETLRQDICEIEKEIRENDLDQTTASWVVSHLSYRQDGIKDPKKEEIMNFITKSLSGRNEKKSAVRRSLVTRYSLIAAASIAVLFLVYRSFAPSGNPETLFRSYYEPFDAVSEVTRGVSGMDDKNFAAALECYKEGDYAAAETGFGDVLVKNSSNMSARFFGGLTKMALADYKGAISYFEEVVKMNSIFCDEAEWYQGLAYLKTGNKAGAKRCFSDLKLSDYYGSRSVKILRRLR